MYKLNFLVADDAGFIRDLVKRALKSQFTQCQIDEAVNGRKAQSLIGRNRYDLVLCDWEMPELSGLEVLEWARAREAEEGLARMPFIMVTSRGDKSHVVKAVEAGVNDYIGKPFSNDQLLRKIFKALSVDHRDLIRSILKGQATMAKPEPPSGDSASLLTSGSPSSQLTGQNSAPSRTPGKRTQLGKVMLRSSKGKWTGVIRDISLTEIAVRMTFEDVPPPALLDQVVVDLQLTDKPEDIARINGFVAQATLKEASLECRVADLGVTFVDDDPEKVAVLSRLVAAVRR